MPPKSLPVWTAQELETQRAASREAFRKTRIDEPVDEYNAEYEKAFQAISTVLETTVDLTELRPHVETLLLNEDLRRALRYTTAPPISDDDLRLLADAKFSKTYLKNNPEALDAFAGVIELLLDKKRLVWIGEDREAEPLERDTAVVATAALDAAQRMQAKRRNSARGLEEEVKEALRNAGYTEVAKRVITTAGHWPAPGQFCGETQVANRQADLAVTLFDSRYLPIEAKVSASALNSIKRLNNDSVAKFTTWTTHFGNGQTLPVAVLEGDFALDRLQAAQTAGAGIFWRHDLAALTAFVSA
jgi:hypothetical protein